MEQITHKRTKKITPKLTDIICWTRMQAEAGQRIESIVERKELERRVGQGVFFWGVGNAPNRSVPSLSSLGEDVDLVFSLMKTRPQKQDTSPAKVVIWRSYFNAVGEEMAIPPHVILTSRLKGRLADKRPHYALVCQSEDELKIGDHGPFSPLLYRNVGPNSGRIAPSQVTALAARVGNDDAVASYSINMRAKLTGSFWVKLGRPRLFASKSRSRLEAISKLVTELTEDEWLDAVAEIRPPCKSLGQPQLFE